MLLRCCLRQERRRIDVECICRETTIECDVEEGTTSIGLHAFRLKIDSAYVGGELCDCHTSPWWDEVLQDSRRYKACLLREVQPELIIDVRLILSSCDSRCPAAIRIVKAAAVQGSFMDLFRVFLNLMSPNFLMVARKEYILR